jgi:hypothetical protein
MARIQVPEGGGRLLASVPRPKGVLGEWGKYAREPDERIRWELSFYEFISHDFTFFEFT